MNSIAPEAELLLSAARLHLGAESAARASAAMERGIAWKRLVPLAYHHGVAPLLHRHLSSGALDVSRIPAATLSELRRVAEAIARRSLFLTGELVALLDTMERAGITCVSLKGPMLAERVYGSVALRRFNDLDLLVGRSDVERASVLLVARGYVLDASRDPGSGDGRDDSLHLSFRSASGTHCVELHQYLTQPIGAQRYDLATIHDAVERIEFHGVHTWVLRPDEHLVYLALHGTTHVWQRLEWIATLAALLEQASAIDWDRAISFARRLHAERALASGLHLAEELFGAAIPWDRVPSRGADRNAALRIARRFVSTPERRPSTLDHLAHLARADTTLRTRTARVWSTLVRPTALEQQAFPLPPSLGALHAVVRPVRLAARWLRRAGTRRTPPTRALSRWNTETDGTAD